MEAKPWEKPSFLNSDDSSRLPQTLDGMLQFIDLIVVANNWRRDRWKQKYSGYDAEIDAEIDARIKRLSIVAYEINTFLDRVKDDDNRDAVERFFLNTMMLGVTINYATLSWALNAAEKGVAREDGQIKSKEKNKKNWSKLQRDAIAALAQVDGDPKLDSKEKRYTAAGKLMVPPVKATTFSAYLKGKPRR